MKNAGDQQKGQTGAAGGSAGPLHASAPVAPEPPQPTREQLRHLQGRKYIKQLGHFIRSLRRTHVHPNRQVYQEDVLVILLLGFFNADIRSLRKLELFSQVPGVRQSLNVNRLCRSTLSEALKLYDPVLLRPLVETLYRELPARGGGDPELQDLCEKILAFDGSYFRVPAQVLWAMRERAGGGQPGRQVRLNLHYCLGTGNPQGLSIGGQDNPEMQAIAADVRPEMIYVADRGVFSFQGVRNIVNGQGHFVFRLRDPVKFTPQAEALLNPQDRAEQILSDRRGHLTGSSCHPPPEVELREILIANADEPDRPIRLLTDLLDLPAHLISLIYRRRWSIELFFRWLKMYANFEHMISHSENGVETWFYVAIIGTLLISLYTGQEPSTYTFTAMKLILAGEAQYEDLAPQLARFARERALARARYARRKAMQNSV